MIDLLTLLEQAPPPAFNPNSDLNRALGQALGLIDADGVYTAPDGTRSTFGNCDPWPNWVGVTDCAVRLLARVLPGFHALVCSSGAPVSAGLPHCLWRAVIKGDYDFVTGRPTQSYTGPNCAHAALAICAVIAKAKGLGAEGVSPRPVPDAVNLEALRICQAEVQDFDTRPAGLKTDIHKAIVQVLQRDHAALRAIDDHPRGLAALVAGKQALFSCSADPELADARGCWVAMLDTLHDPEAPTNPVGA